MKKIKEIDNKKEMEEEKEKQAISEETNDYISWVKEIKKGKKSTEIEILETSIDGVPDLRLCRIDSYKESWGDRPLFTFVTVAWFRRNWGGFQDAGIFYKSFHADDWQGIPIVSWFTSNFEIFLKRFPEVKDIFREYPRIPRGKVKIEFSSGGENEVAEGWASFDGEYVKIDDYEGNECSVEPWEIESIQEIEDEGIDF